VTKATVTPEVTLHALPVNTALSVHTINTLRYEHDPKKLAANVAGHGVWFHEADDFDWKSAVVNLDSRRARSESRLAAVGYIGDRLHVMVFTLSVNVVRIISLRNLRRANRREVKRYAET